MYEYVIKQGPGLETGAFVRKLGDVFGRRAVVITSGFADPGLGCVHGVRSLMSAYDVAKLLQRAFGQDADVRPNQLKLAHIAVTTKPETRQPDAR